MERWSSWFKAPVLKTGVGLRLPWVRIPVSPPYKVERLIPLFTLTLWRSTQVGRRGAPAKGVGRLRGARVRIPPSPPDQANPNPLPIGDGFGFVVFLVKM